MKVSFLKPLFNFCNSYKYELLIIVLVLIFFWPMLMGHYIPKWDSIDGYLPYRYMVGEYFKIGHLPLWHPFEHLGTPLYSDLQSGAWNPIVWVLILLFGGYEIQALITEFLLCYAIAGIGMFKLAKYLFKTPCIAFILAVSYTFSGFMVGSAHVMVGVLGIAWLPWITYFFLLIIQKNKLKHVILFSLSLALHITSASPAYTILLVYFLFFTLVYFLIKKKNSGYSYKKLFLHLLYSLVLLLVLISPYIYSFYEFLPYFNRSDKLSLDSFLINPFTTKEYISFVFPYATTSDTNIFSDTDITLRNGYFGVVGLCGFLWSFLFIKNKKILLLIMGVIVSLVFASGKQSGLYEYLIHIPGIGLFRHPSLYKTYTIFLGLILSGYVLKQFYSKNILNKYLKIWSIGLFILISVIVLFLFQNTSFNDISSNLWLIYNGVEHSQTNASTHIVINGLIIISLIFVGWVIYLIFKIKPLKILTVMVVLEFFLITSLLSPKTVYLNTSVKSTKSYFTNIQSGIDQKHNHLPLKYLNHNHNFPPLFGFWQNLSILHKRPSYDGYNPMRFKKYDEISNDSLFNYIIENPLIYSPKKILQSGDSIQPKLIWGIQSDDISLNSSDVNNIAVQYNGFTANIDNNSNKPSWIVLNQNYHHNWNAFLNDQKVKVENVNSMVMGIKVPANYKGNVAFWFQSEGSVVLFYVSIFGYLFCLYFLAKSFIHSKSSQR